MGSGLWERGAVGKEAAHALAADAAPWDATPARVTVRCCKRHASTSSSPLAAAVNANNARSGFEFVAIVIVRVCEGVRGVWSGVGGDVK